MYFPLYTLFTEYNGKISCHTYAYHPHFLSECYILLYKNRVISARNAETIILKLAALGRADELKGVKW